MEKKGDNRIRGIDSIRFVCAVVVLLGHITIPLPKSFDGPLAYGIYRDIGAIIKLVFFGPAAVIVFFIISGFCIHFPFRKTYQIHLPSYYSRRLIRIGIPAIIAVALGLYFGSEMEYPLFGVFWSIICEVVYYLLYPFIIWLRRFISWEQIVLISFIIALVTALSNTHLLRSSENSYGALGLFTWVIGFPCWLLGCWLAENYQRFSKLSFSKMWFLRVIVIIISMVICFARFHFSTILASTTITLNLFAIPSCIWLGYEIIYFQNNEPTAFLEWCGKWSYSLYIMHGVGANLGLLFAIWLGLPFLENHFVFIAAAFIVSIIFYYSIEFPSHRLAKYVGNRLRPMVR